MPSIVGMNGKILEPVNNGPKHPFWETEFFYIQRKMPSFESVEHVHSTYSSAQDFGWFYAKKILNEVLQVLYFSKPVLRTWDLCWLLLLFPLITMKCGEGLEWGAQVYFCNSIYVAGFCHSWLCLSNPDVEWQCCGSRVLECTSDLGTDGIPNNQFFPL